MTKGSRAGQHAKFHRSSLTFSRDVYGIFSFGFLSIEDFGPSSSLKSQKLRQKAKKTRTFWKFFARLFTLERVVSARKLDCEGRLPPFILAPVTQSYSPKKERKKEANYFHSNYYCYGLVTEASCTFHNNHFHAILACLQRNPKRKFKRNQRYFRRSII